MRSPQEKAPQSSTPEDRNDVAGHGRSAEYEAPCPTCDGERYDTTYEGYPAEDGGPGPCVTCNGSGTTTPRVVEAEPNWLAWRFIGHA